MEFNVKKVENGFIIRMDGEDPVEGYISKEYIFQRESQVVKFLRERFAALENNA
jgi:hypothetical protein